MTLPDFIAAAAIGAILLIAASGLYCWGLDNGHWGQGPGVE